MSAFQVVNGQELTEVSGGLAPLVIIAFSAGAIGAMGWGNLAGQQGSIVDAALAGMHEAKHG
jgi:lactobin A/cerein 7B family class IIb bacteriocin